MAFFNLMDCPASAAAISKVVDSLAAMNAVEVFDVIYCGGILNLHVYVYIHTRTCTCRWM